MVRAFFFQGALHALIETNLRKLRNSSFQKYKFIVWFCREVPLLMCIWIATFLVVCLTDVLN